MTAGILISCRTDSGGEPERPLVSVLGRPAISHLVDLLRRPPVGSAVALPVILSTTERRVDDPIEAYAMSESLSVCRGEADDDARRLLGAARRFELDWFVVIDGAAAIVDPDVVRDAVEKAIADELDVVSTVPSGTFPSGMNVEVLRTEFLADQLLKPSENNASDVPMGVTSFFDRWPDESRRHVLHNSRFPSLAGRRLTLDTPADVRLVEFCLRHVHEAPGRSVLATLDHLLDRYAPTQPWVGSHGPLLIAEIGGNHEGDFQRARALTEQAVGVGPDFVKFQIYTGDSLVSPVADPKRHGHFQTLELTRDQHLELACMCRDAGVGYMASVWDMSAVDWVDPVLEIYKVGSGDLVATSVIRRIAQQGRPIILSTGLGTESDVLAAINTLAAVDARYRNPEWLALLQCTSAYPIENRDANLAVMRRLHELTGLPTGYSDHTEGTAALEVAAALGARVLEFHFTDRRTDPSFRDHLVSLLPDEVTCLQRYCDDVIRLLGSGHKRLIEVERETGQLRSSRRALYPARDLPTGHRIDSEDLVALRPNDGIDVREVDRLVGRRVDRPLSAFAPIAWTDLGDD